MEYDYKSKQAVLGEVIAQQEAIVKHGRRDWHESVRDATTKDYQERIDVLKQVQEDLFRLEGLDK